jgi:hypothetical protein
MQRVNVRVVQARDGLRLVLEPLLEIGVGGDVLGQDLDGDGAVQAGIAGFVDFTHTARAGGREDLVGRVWYRDRGAWVSSWARAF